MQAGLPVAVPDIGAFAERVAGRPWSWVHPWNLTGAQWVKHFTHLREAHFATAQAPTLPAPPPTHVATQASWSYRQSYLEGASLARPSPPVQLEHATLARYRPRHTATSASRSDLLSALMHLRSLPVLRGIAQAIPAHWQRRVKNWLKA